MPGPLTTMLSIHRPLLLDGAMGTELQRRGVDTGTPLWSAMALTTHPDTVLQIHKDYIDAGADIITTDTFRTTNRTFRRAHLPDRSAELTARAVDLARCACETVRDRHVLVAGSAGPLEDCYRPDLVPPEPELRSEHAELAQRLAAAGVDFILLETMGTIREAVAACSAAADAGKEVVVSFICNDQGDLYGGESITEAVKELLPLEPAGFSINCVSPRFLHLAICLLKSATDLPFAAYGNVGRPGQERTEGFVYDIPAEEYAAYAQDWARTGAAIIGGCCGTTPEYIAALRRIIA